MKTVLIMLATLWATAAYAASPAAIDSTLCGAIRTQIQAQTGILATPDTALLQKLGAHGECGFTATEVYRAAYGDKALPKNTHSDRQRRHRDDHD
jgi:hypothetical protein